MMSEERRALPPPVTQADEYLHDIALSLRYMNVVLAQVAVEISAAAAPAEGDLVALREPEPMKPKRRTRDEA